MKEYRDVYWKKVSCEGLYLQYCINCNKYIFYPRSLCPYCLGSNLEWKKLSGKGKVFTYTIVHVSALPEFSEKTPYIYAIIELDEGVKIPTNLLDCSLEEVRVNMPVELTLIEEGGKKLPVFKPLN